MTFPLRRITPPNPKKPDLILYVKLHRVSPQVQWNLLMEQQASNVWRKRAFSAMKSAHEQFGKDAHGSDKLLGCLDTFRERVDHNVENTVPAGLVR